MTLVDSLVPNNADQVVHSVLWHLLSEGWSPGAERRGWAPDPRRKCAQRLRLRSSSVSTGASLRLRPPSREETTVKTYLQGLQNCQTGIKKIEASV